jgi:hypothetical protein
MRITMITAAEVSLGLAPGADPAGGRSKPWPIEIFWHCSQNWFEGWVTWRKHGDHPKTKPGPGDPGQVTVLLCTPSAGTPVRPSPLSSAAPAGDERDRAEMPAYAVGPPNPDAARGMVVVTHKQHYFIPPAVNPLQPPWGKGELNKPFPAYWQGSGPVITVSPSEPDGGVLPAGRTY